MKIICEKFAGFLQKKNIDLFNQPVGIWGEKNSELIALTIAILRSGNGYLPIHPDWPPDRAEFIISQAGLQLCFVEKKYTAKAEAVLKKLDCNYTIDDVDENYSAISIHQKKKRYVPDLAYILFTSGSTGFPKGIVHDSGSMMRFLNWCQKEFSKYRCKRFVSIAPLNFDLSVFDVFFSLSSGGRLFMPQTDTLSNTRLFVDYICTNKIEAIYTTPSYLRLLLQTGRPEKFDLSCVKLLLIAGEPLHYGLVKQLRDHFKKAVCYNLYGPTETNVCAFHKISLPKQTDAEMPVPIGKACYRGELKVSSNGELIYKGNLLMKAFIDEKGLHRIRKNTSYKTGDLVKKLTSGDLEFEGRKDSLVKRNGFRIEPGEIRRALSSHAAIDECVVLDMKKETIRIIAFVRSSEALSEYSLKSFCLEKLPSYMLPDRIIVLNEFPLNANHKTDLRKLKELYIN